MKGGDYEVDGIGYNQRFRYRITGRFPVLKLNGQKVIFAAVFDEIWGNLDNNFSVESFKQNWFFAGLRYQFNKKANLQAGYLNQVIRKSDGIHYEINPTISVPFFIVLI